MACLTRDEIHYAETCKGSDDVIWCIVGISIKGAEIAGRISMKTLILLYRGAARRINRAITPLPVIEMPFPSTMPARHQDGWNFSPAPSSVSPESQAASPLAIFNIRWRSYNPAGADEVQDILLTLKKGLPDEKGAMIANTTAKTGIECDSDYLRNESIETPWSGSQTMPQPFPLREENKFLQNVILKDSHETVVFSDKEGSLFSTLESGSDLS